MRELARLVGTSDDDVIRNRFEVAQEVAHQMGASILLKGVPTVITGPDGRFARLRVRHTGAGDGRQRRRARGNRA